jgi:hypothetical protein
MRPASDVRTDLFQKYRIWGIRYRGLGRKIPMGRSTRRKENAVTGLMKRGLSVGVVLASISIIHTTGVRLHRLLIKRSAPAAQAERWSKPEVVLLDDSVPTNLVASLAQDSKRQFVMLRQTLKLRQHRTLAGDEAGDSTDRAREAIEQNGVKYVVVTDLAPHSAEGDGLRVVVHADSRFELLGTFPFPTSDANGQTHKLYLYENTETRHFAQNQTPIAKDNVTNADQAFIAR